jgi:hypothetical protein
MPIQLLSTPTQLRAAIRRLARSAERIDVLVSAISDPELTGQLAAAARRGADVRLTVNLDASTPPDSIALLREAGVDVGVFEPAVHRRRSIRRFKPGVIIFDHETDWWSAAITGSFSGTAESLAEHLEIVTLVESDDFREGDEAGRFLAQLLPWADSISHTTVDARKLSRHQRACEAAAGGQGGAGSPPRPARTTPRSTRVIEAKPEVVGYASPLSWQQIGRADWGTYWSALQAADRLRGSRLSDGLCGPAGWLRGIDATHGAYAAGPQAWPRERVRDELLGQTKETSLLGRVKRGTFAELVTADAGFRDALHDAVEQCIAEPAAEPMRGVLRPIVARPGVSVAEISRVLAAAAPDRFFSILGRAMQLRLSNVVGFDLTAQTSAVQDQLTRYVDAIDVIRSFPWAAEASAERTSDHDREADAWAKRVALLGCLIC